MDPINLLNTSLGKALDELKDLAIEVACLSTKVESMIWVQRMLAGTMLAGIISLVVGVILYLVKGA